MTDLNVLLVDDHKVVRDGLKFVFNLQRKFNMSIFDAENGKEALNLAKQIDLDLIIMDLRMPQGDGIRTTKAIREFNEDVKILALSMHDEEHKVSQMISAGANGFVLKNTSSRELLTAIDTILEGKKYYCMEIASKLLYYNQQYNSDESTIPIKSSGKNIFSKRQIEVLELIAEGNTTEECAKELGVSKRTIEDHKRKMVKKSGVKNVAGLVRFAMLHGFIE